MTARKRKRAKVEEDKVNLESDEAAQRKKQAVTKVTEHQRMLLGLLVFDVWSSLLAAPAGVALQATLANSAVEAERQLAHDVQYCITSLPSNTDEWIRLFISCVQDMDRVGVVISDMSLSCAPIIYANTGFLAISGYRLEEIVGVSCRFMQGAQTDPEAVEVIRDSIRSGTQAHVRLLNYRKDGSAFINMLSLRPIYDRDGHFVSWFQYRSKLWNLSAAWHLC